MTSGRRGLPIVKEYEQCRLVAYQDPNGVWTIGWGHTKDVKEDDTCTQAQADQWLIDEYDEAEAIVLNVVKVPLNDDQLGALTSFVYNVGPGEVGKKDGFCQLIGGGPSHLLIYCNRNDFENAAKQFDLWVHDGGVTLLGLVRRRAAEKALFMS